MNEDLNRKAVKGLSWSMLETISKHIVKFFVSILLARLLMPSDFGVLGIIMIFIYLSDIIVSSGFGKAFIQRKDVSSADANTVFYINFLISLCIYLILYISAPYVGLFFHNENIPSLIRVLSIGVIISSFNIIQNAIIERNLNYRKRAVMTVLSSVLSGIVGISCAYFGLGVWSLVYQQLSQRLILCIFLYTTSSWHPSFDFSKHAAKEMFSFGSWLLVSNLIFAAFKNLYKAAFGKCYSISDLGYYERAYQYETMVSETFTWMFASVSYSVFTKIQDDKDAVKRTTMNFVKYSSVFVYPILLCMLISAKPLIVFLVTEKWLPAVFYMQLLCIVGLLSPLTNFMSQVLQATGNSKLYFVFISLICAFRSVNVVTLLRFGISAIIIGDFFCILLSIIIVSFLARKDLGFHYISVVRVQMKIVPMLFIASMTCYIVLSLLSTASSFVQLLFSVASFFTVYLLLMLKYQHKELSMVMKMIGKQK